MELVKPKKGTTMETIGREKGHPYFQGATGKPRLRLFPSPSCSQGFLGFSAV